MAVEVEGLMVIEGDDFRFFGSVAGGDDLGGGFRAEDGAVAAEVVGVGVGDEAEIDLPVGIEMEAEFWEEDAFR